jgi:hypothetical protein
MRFNMSYLNVASGAVVSELPGEQRAGFIRRTYTHVAGAIAVFAILEAYLLSLGWGETALALLSQSSWSWLLVLGAFMGVGIIANKWAHSGASRDLQYAGLGLYVVAEAFIFLPLMHMAITYAPGVLENAAVVTASLVAALTLIVFTTRKDFSFMGPALAIGGMIALGVIVCAIAFGIQLGTFFSAVMILFAGGCVLYSTSNVLHTYREDQHVAASLSLFASIALMFWYVVQFLMSFGGD